MPKRIQDAHFAVLDVSVGHTDLQQCADAVMRPFGDLYPWWEPPSGHSQPIS